MSDAAILRVNLTEQVRERLLREVMDGEREAGARLNVDALAREFRVSTTPVREALAALAATGLVRTEPFVGYTVAPVAETAFLDDLHEFRLRVEPWLAARAARRADKALIAGLRACVANMSPATRAGPWSAHRAHADADAGFHDALAEAAANEPARQALSRLHMHLHLSRRYLAKPGGAEATAEEHAAILRAVEAQDASAAERAMVQHLTASRERLLG